MLYNRSRMITTRDGAGRRLCEIFPCAPRRRLKPRRACVRLRALAADATASWMSLGMMVTRLAWMAQRLVSSKRPAVRLGRLLEREDGVRLEAEVRLEVLGDLADEALEGSLRMSSSGLRTYCETKKERRGESRGGGMGGQHRVRKKP